MTPREEELFTCRLAHDLNQLLDSFFDLHKQWIQVTLDKRDAELVQRIVDVVASKLEQAARESA